MMNLGQNVAVKSVKIQLNRNKMETYKIELKWEEINTLIFSGIYGGLEKIEKNIKQLAKENPETPEEEWRTHYQDSINNLESARIKIEQQMFDQGNTIIGRDHRSEE